jgi:translocation and assembly module TamB
MKHLRLILLLLLIPLGLASMAIIWLCYTASGLQFALLQLNHVPNMTVQVRGVTGRLAGPLHVDHIALDHERIHIDIEQLDIDLTPAYLLSGLIEVNHLHIKQINASLKPSLHHTPDTPIHFLPTFLRISVDELQLQRAQYTHTNGYTLLATPLKAAASLSRNRLRVEQLEVVTQEFDARGRLQIDSTDVLSLIADLDAGYKVANGPVLRGSMKAHGPVTGQTRQLQVAAVLQQPHQASIDAALAFPDSGWSLQGTARADQILLNAWWPQPSFSLAKLAMQFKLSDAGMHYVGEVVVPEWSPAPLHVDADTHYAQRIFTIERADVSVPQSGVRTRTMGTITLQTGARPLLDMHGSWSYLQWPLQVAKQRAVFTSQQGTLNLHGTEPYQFDVAARVALPQWPDSSVQAVGQIRPGEIQLTNYTLRTLQGVASGTARVAFTAPRAWQFMVRATGINPAEFKADWPGRLNLQANAQGQGFDINAPFDLRLQSLTGVLRNQSVNASGRLQHHEKQWRADGVNAQWGRAQLTAQGGVGAQNSLQWSLNAPVLKQLHPDLSGELIMTGAFSGAADALQLSLRAQSTRMAYATWQIEDLKLETHLDMTDHSASQLDIGAARVAHGDVALEKLHLVGTGQTSEHQLTLQATPVESLLPKGLQFTMQVSGGYAQSTWRGVLNALQVVDAQKAARLKLVEAAPMTLSAEHLELQSLCVTLDMGRACMQGEWLSDARRGTSWNAHASVQDLPIVISNEAISDSAYLRAQVNGQMDLSAAANSPWQGSAQLHMADASIRYKLITGREQVLPISLAEMNMTADTRAVQLAGELRLGEQTVTSLTASLDRSIGTGLDSWPLSGVLGFSSSDAKLIPVFVNEVDRAAGTLAAALQLSGTAAAPRFAGNLRLLQGELDFYQLNLALRALELDAQIDTDQLRFTVQGNAGEGLLNASGDLNWHDAKLAGTLQLKGDRLLVADLPEYRVLATPDMRFDIDDHNIHVKGEVLIPEARLQPKEVVGAVQTSADARFKTDQLLESKSSPWLINSEISIRLGDNVNFDGLGLQGKLQGTVDTRLRTGDVAIGSGELSVANGRYEAYGQKLDIKRGRLIYDSTPLGDPGLDIQAERKINDTVVGVNVRGVLRAPRLQFYSDPSMSQTQIVSYLLVGRPLDELQGQQKTTVTSASNALAMQGGGFLAAQLGRRIGLEQVGVETDSNNQSALVIGKFLSPRLFISYGISLTEAINTIKLRYTLNDHWTLKTEAGEAKSADIEFKIER